MHRYLGIIIALVSFVVNASAHDDIHHQSRLSEISAEEFNEAHRASAEMDEVSLRELPKDSACLYLEKWLDLLDSDIHYSDLEPAEDWNDQRCFRYMPDMPNPYLSPKCLRIISVYEVSGLREQDCRLLTMWLHIDGWMESDYDIRTAALFALARNGEILSCDAEQYAYIESDHVISDTGNLAGITYDFLSEEEILNIYVLDTTRPETMRVRSVDEYRLQCHGIDRILDGMFWVGSNLYFECLGCDGGEIKHCKVEMI